MKKDNITFDIIAPTLDKQTIHCLLPLWQQHGAICRAYSFLFWTTCTFAWQHNGKEKSVLELRNEKCGNLIKVFQSRRIVQQRKQSWKLKFLRYFTDQLLVTGRVSKNCCCFQLMSLICFFPPLTESAEVPYSCTSIVEAYVKPGKIRLWGRGSLPWYHLVNETKRKNKKITFLWPVLSIVYKHLIKQVTLSSNPNFLSTAGNFCLNS